LHRVSEPDTTLVSAAEERRRKEELRQGLQRESARFTPTEVASGEEALRGFREGTAQTDTFSITKQMLLWA
jgi:hypothetical protein